LTAISQPGGGVETVIEAEGLRKRFGSTEALGGVDLSVRAGSVLGLLGPNGAGKTTAVRVLTTLLRPDSGRATVAGYDVVRQAREVRRRIGVAGQYASVDELLTGRENLVLLGVLRHLGRTTARRRAAELLDGFGLVDAADRPVRTYSGGMRRRLDLASCLVVPPTVLFLDEPTTGLDPASRMTLWAATRALVAEGVTVLLTTQYLEEADHLADRIVVMAAGRVIADGSPEELKRKVGSVRLEVSVEFREDLARAMVALSAVLPGRPTVDEAAGSVSLRLDDGMGDVGAAAVALRDAGVRVLDLVLHRPTLDEVFIDLTGSAAE
jgi:ABC-2 type transport system ATP-binding protein